MPWFGTDTRGIFTERYGDIAHLITIRVDEQLIQAMVRFWDPAYQCFTFNQEDMTPTIEEYAALLRIDNVQFGKIYVKEPKPMTFKKKLVERTPFHMFSKAFSPLEAYLKKEWPKEVTEEHWVSVFQNLQAEDITWRAPWIRPSILLYKCGSQDWVPLLGLWGGVGYAPLLVQR
ncbi:hypothetical protein CXB51_007616 [Gossypium anomalum]|uniref:DUF7745 domain-containing protein n=1 Tax=Gossypium anomalum TaxID=47600 RepID=A0A8J5Z7V2_9ROSI|nr:hypothetical protein CXB51_007616 [Gossypium anomalum]